MLNIEKILDKYFWILMFLLLIPATWALFVPGYYGASDDIHIAWLHQMDKTIRLGQIPPRFVPDLSYGFGYPLFNFVFPLPFYIAEIFHLLNFSLVDSIKALFFLSSPFSFLFMYLLLRQFSLKSLSFVGALLYIYTPYRAVDLYVRGAIGEIVSFVFLPLILLSIVKLKNEKDFKWVGIGGIALASLVLSHNITAYMFSAFILLFMVMQFFFIRPKLAFFSKSIFMFFLALLICIYFWLPAVVESKLMKYDTVFNFADHFPTLKQLITPYWGYGASVPGPGDGISFFIGTVNLLLIIGGIVCLLKYWKKYSRSQKILFIWVYFSILVSIFMMNFRSKFMWDNIPFLPYFQFPWRFLIMTTFLSPLLVVTFEKVRSNKLTSTFLIFLIMITATSYFRPQDFLGRQDEYFINRYIPTPIASEEYRETGEEYLRLPKNTKMRPDKNYPLVISENALININRINNLYTVIDVASTEGTNLNYNKYFFPGWVAKIDGQQIDITIGEPFGQIVLDIPPGAHLVEIKFEETNFRNFLNAISLGAFLVSLGLIFNLWQRMRKFCRFF